MKKVITLSLLACAFAATAFADESGAVPGQMVRMSAAVNYNVVSMDQVNDYLQQGASVTHLSSGMGASLGLDMGLAPSVMIGGRLGYLYCGPASASYDYLLFTQTTTLDASLLPIEVGLSANFALPATPLTLRAGIYGGYGFAFASIKNDFSALGQTRSVTQTYDGGGFIGDLLATVSIKLASALSFDINAGYRLAKIPQMTQSQDADVDLIPGVSIPVGAKGDVLKDADNNDMVFDFSGFNAGVGLSLGF